MFARFSLLSTEKWVGKKNKKANEDCFLDQEPSEYIENKSWLLLPQHQSTYPRGPQSVSIEIPPFRPHFIKFLKTVFY